MTKIVDPHSKKRLSKIKDAPFGGGFARNVNPLKHEYQATAGGSENYALAERSAFPSNAYVKRKLVSSTQDVRTIQASTVY